MYVYFLRIFLFPLRKQTVCHSPHCEREQGNISFFILKLSLPGVAVVVVVVFISSFYVLVFNKVLSSTPMAYYYHICIRS